MDRTLQIILVFVAAAVLFIAAAAAALFWPRRQPAGGGYGSGHDYEMQEAEPDDAADEPDDSAQVSRSSQSGRKSGKTLEERNKDKFDVGEMRREAEDMLRRFRGTPEERQDVIEECEAGKALLLAITDDALAAYDDMSPEDLRKAREEFEKDYRAELNYLQTGKLQRMLKTPEEQEVIGSTIEVVQQFLERLDEGLHAAGY